MEHTQNLFAQQVLGEFIRGESLHAERSSKLVLALMQGQIDPVLIGALLTAWRIKGEQQQELLGAARAMRQLATKLDIPLDPPVIDLVGTGGDGAHLFNVSTAACFVVAACGGRVAKHCGRGVSSSSGSADLLAGMGVDIQAGLEQQQQRFNATGLVFMPAPNHHPAMRFAAPVRQLLKQRTIFNLLGPLTNPAGVRRYLLGVYSQDLLETMAVLLRDLGAERAMVVHSQDGLDEISIAAPTWVCELDQGQLHSYQLDPKALGVQGSLHSCRVDGVQASLQTIRNAASGANPDAARQIAVNAGAGLYLLGLARDIAQGVQQALKALAGLEFTPEGKL